MTEETWKYLSAAGLTEVQKRTLVDLGYSEAPASIHHHLNTPGGLAIHSTNVTRRLVQLTQALKISWDRDESPYLVGMLHDVCKALTYRRSYSDDKFKFRSSGLPGHGIQSAAIVMSALGIHLTNKELYCIAWHMGAFNLSGDDLACYDAALKIYPTEIVVTHTADMLATHVDEREGDEA